MVFHVCVRDSMGRGNGLEFKTLLSTTDFMAATYVS